MEGKPGEIVVQPEEERHPEHSLEAPDIKRINNLKR